MRKLTCKRRRERGREEGRNGGREGGRDIDSDSGGSEGGREGGTYRDFHGSKLIDEQSRDLVGLSEQAEGESSDGVVAPGGEELLEGLREEGREGGREGSIKMTSV